MPACNNIAAYLGSSTGHVQLPQADFIPAGPAPESIDAALPPDIHPPSSPPGLYCTNPILKGGDNLLGPPSPPPPKEDDANDEHKCSTGESEWLMALQRKLKTEHLVLLDTTLTPEQLDFLRHAMIAFKEKGLYLTTISGEVARIHGLRNHQLISQEGKDQTFNKHRDFWNGLFYGGRKGSEWLRDIDVAAMKAIGVDDVSQPASTAIHYQEEPGTDLFLKPGYTPPNFGQMAHVDHPYGLDGGIAVICSIYDMKSTEVLHTNEGVIPWCWEHAMASSFNVKAGQMYCFDLGAPHRGPDSTADDITRSSYFAGFVKNPEDSEVTYNESRIQEMYLNRDRQLGANPDTPLPPSYNIQAQGLSCCPDAWEQEPEVQKVPVCQLHFLSKWAREHNALVGFDDVTLGASRRRPAYHKSGTAYNEDGLFDGFDKLFPQDSELTECMLGKDGALEQWINHIVKEPTAEVVLDSFSVQSRNEPQTLVNKRSHGNHRDSLDVAFGNNRGIIVIGLEYGSVNGVKCTSQAEFKRSTRSMPAKLTLTEGHFYVIDGPWIEGLHRFSTNGPRVMIRIGYHVIRKGEKNWDYDAHQEARRDAMKTKTKTTSRSLRQKPVAGIRSSKRLKQDPKNIEEGLQDEEPADGLVETDVSSCRRSSSRSLSENGV